MSIRRPRHRNRGRQMEQRRNTFCIILSSSSHTQNPTNTNSSISSSTEGRHCWPMLLCKPLQSASSTMTAPISPTLKATSQLLAEAPAPRPDPSGLPTKELWLGGHTDRSRHNAERLPNKMSTIFWVNSTWTINSFRAVFLWKENIQDLFIASTNAMEPDPSIPTSCQSMD